MDFRNVLFNRISEMQRVLGDKEKEYALEGDRYHNFKVAGLILNQSPEKALVGMWAKHLVSVLDIVNSIDRGEFTASSRLIDEKIGDAINYLVLLEGMLMNRLENSEAEPAPDYFKANLGYEVKDMPPADF